MINYNKQTQKRFADSMEYVHGNQQLSKLAKLSDADLMTVEDRGIQAGFLSNAQKKIFDSIEGRDFVKTNNYGPYLPELYPIITAWYPEFPLKDLISVQDMEQPLAYIITSELLTATDKSDTAKGEKVETPSGPRTIKGRYPTGEVFGEKLLAADFTTESTKLVGTLLYYPILTGKDELENLKIVTAATSDHDWEVASVVSGKITLTDGASASVVIEAATGIIEVSGVTDLVSLTANYVWNIEYADNSNIPSVVEDMKMKQMEAKPRALAMEWTIFSEYVKKKQFGVDIRTQTTKRVLDLLYQYLVRYILDKMYYNATGTETTVAISTTNVDLNLRVQEALKKLNDVSQTVQVNTGRIEGNCLVIGNNFKAFLESLPDNFYKPEAKNSDYGFNGPRKIGHIGRFTVFYDDKLAANKGWMTYKGNEWYDAAYYLGVFLPIAPTDAVNINIKVKQAFIAMEGHLFDKPAAVIPLVFTGV